MKYGAGILFVCLEDSTLLLAKRSRVSTFPRLWAVVGGAIEKDEEPYECALREVKEELGSLPDEMIGPLETSQFANESIDYITYIMEVPLESKKKWNIKLNHEHEDFRWFSMNYLPDRMHPGVVYTITDLVHSDV